MVNIVCFKGEDCKIAADIALKNRLYVSGWSLSGYLIDVRKGRKTDTRIALAYKDNKPVGVSLQMSYGLTMCFTKKAYRRQGIGRQLTKCFKNKSSYGTWGLDGAEYFWKNVGYQYK